MSYEAVFMSHSIASFVLLSSQRRDGSPCRRMFIDIPIVLQSGIAVRDHSSSQGCVPAPGVCTEFEEVGVVCPVCSQEMESCQEEEPCYVVHLGCCTDC